MFEIDTTIFKIKGLLSGNIRMTDRLYRAIIMAGSCRNISRVKPHMIKLDCENEDIYVELTHTNREYFYDVFDGKNTGG